jgi:CspA family cold shock protein
VAALFIEETDATGKIKFFAHDRGFGFIKPDGGVGPEVFVHIRDLQAANIFTPVDGMSVGFEIEIDNRGRRRATVLRRF